MTYEILLLLVVFPGIQFAGVNFGAKPNSVLQPIEMNSPSNQSTISEWARNVERKSWQ
jgi:hypothetical protein